jgi:hypothetical protein
LYYKTLKQGEVEDSDNIIIQFKYREIKKEVFEKVSKLE